MKKIPTVSLGALQNNLEAAAKELRSAQSLFQRASERLLAAQEAHNSAIISLNQGLGTVRSETSVQNVLAR